MKTEECDDISKFLRAAKRKALSHAYDDRVGFQHAAILVNSNKIIAIGYNGIHDMSIRFDKNKARQCGRLQNEKHAEIDAIFKARAKRDVRGSKIYIARILKNGQFAQSKPCELCQHVLFNYGISRCIYSISENEFGVWIPHNPAEKFFKIAA